MRSLGTVGLLLATLFAGTRADGDACYGEGELSLRQVGDYSTFRDQNGAYTTYVATSAAYDAILNLQRVTTQMIGGSADGRLFFDRRLAHQVLSDGWDQQTVIPNLGLVNVSTRYVPAVPTNYPLCPGEAQHSQGGVTVSALGLTVCTGSWERTMSPVAWETVDVPFGSFEALRITDEFSIIFDCGYSPVQDLDTVWLVPGIGAARIDSGGNSWQLVDTNLQPVPEPKGSELALVAAAGIGSIGQLRRYRLSLAGRPLTAQWMTWRRNDC